MTSYYPNSKNPGHHSCVFNRNICSPKQISWREMITWSIVKIWKISHCAFFGISLSTIHNILDWAAKTNKRLCLGMCSLVGLSFFFLLVSENMPPSESVPLIGGYYSVTMIQMGFSFFMNILVLRLHHMTDNKVPYWVRVSRCICKMSSKSQGLGVHFVLFPVFYKRAAFYQNYPWTATLASEMNTPLARVCQRA